MGLSVICLNRPCRKLNQPQRRKGAKRFDDLKNSMQLSPFTPWSPHCGNLPRSGGAIIYEELAGSFRIINALRLGVFAVDMVFKSGTDFRSKNNKSLFQIIQESHDIR